MKKIYIVDLKAYASVRDYEIVKYALPPHVLIDGRLRIGYTSFQMECTEEEMEDFAEYMRHQGDLKIIGIREFEQQTT